jgi:hypothetical protein
MARATVSPSNESDSGTVALMGQLGKALHGVEGQALVQKVKVMGSTIMA